MSSVPRSPFRGMFSQPPGSPTASLYRLQKQKFYEKYAQPAPAPAPALQAPVPLGYNPYTIFSVNTPNSQSGASQPTMLSGQQERQETQRKGRFRFRTNDFSANSNSGVNY